MGIETWAEVVPGRLKIAYEPVWAIGTGVVAKEGEISEMHDFLRERLVRAWGAAGETVPLLYGGSVTPENFPGILRCSEVNGALVGGASLQPEKFTALLQQVLA
jgi:triosephosphate isomerase